MKKLRDLLSTNLNIANFQTRQKVLLLVVIAPTLILIFDLSSRAVSSQKQRAENAVTDARIRLDDVQRYIVMRQSSQQNAQRLDAGLLSYIEGIKQRHTIQGDIVNIRLVNSANRQEQVSFRAENLVYQEFVAILNDLEQYDNIWIKTISLTKRFDNPLRIDVAFDIIRDGVQ